MKTSERGVLMIAGHEGIVPGPYLDTAGVWTWGIGHTAAAGGPDPAALPRGMPGDLDTAILDALRLFAADLGTCEARVRDAITVPLAQHEFDALVSFDFNTGGIYRAKLTEAINRGDMSGDGFMGWLKPPEIRRRREAEQALFRNGDYDATGGRIPIWKVDETGRLRGILKAMSGAELRAMMARAGAGRSTGQGLLALLLQWLKCLFGGKA